MKTAYRHIGKNTPRRDAKDIVTGRAEYIDDIRPADMLHGKVLRSPHAHADIIGIDISDALKAPGVKAVLTHESVPPWQTGMPRHQKVLDKRVRFVGDAAALVAAETEEQALAALDLIRVDYQKLPAVFDMDTALAEGAPLLHDMFPGNIVSDFPAFGPGTIKEVKRGDVEKGFKEADVISEGTFGYENIANPLPIEPPGVIAKWEDEKKLTVWSGTQSASWHRWIMQSKMGFPDIRAITTQCGGSFGSKNYAPQCMFYAAALAKATGEAVKVYFTKDEHFGAFVLRLSSRFQGRIGMKKDGTVTAVEGEWLIDNGAYCDMSQSQVAVGCGEAQLVINCENWNLSTKLVCTNRCPSGVIRGFGGQELESAFAPVLADAMTRAAIDPVEFFKKNYIKPGGQFIWREGNLWTCRGRDYTRAMEEGAAAFQWKEKFKGWLKPTLIDGYKRRGVGVGIHGNADVGEDDSEAYIRLNSDGTAVIHASVSESGMGQRSSLCKMAAEVLGLDIENVHMTDPDTRVNPFDFGLVGSRGTYAVGTAVIEAAEDALEKLFKRCARKLGADPSELATKDGKVFLKENPEKNISWSHAIGIMRSVTGFGEFKADYSIPNFLILFVEVEIDTRTGSLDLIKVVTSTDAGQVIDPPSLHGQLFGALGSAGIDTAVFEETILDPRTGHMLNMNLSDYKWRTFNDLPDFENVILETPLPTHRFQAVGVGEIATSPGPPAVLMAASNALGCHLNHYPLTPDRILAAWAEQEKNTDETV